MTGSFANSIPVPDGLKTKVKTAFGLAFRDAMSLEFWQNIDDSMQDLRPEEQVVEEFPVQKMRFPFVRVAVSFGKANWMNVNRWFFQEHAQAAQNAEIDVRVSVDMFALSSKQRDRIEDMYLFMLLFGYTRQDTVAFYKHMNRYDDVSIKPILNSISIDRDSSTKDIPWCRDTVVYQGTLSFDSKVTFAFNKGDFASRVRMINMQTKDSNGFERQTILAGA